MTRVRGLPRPAYRRIATAASQPRNDEGLGAGNDRLKRCDTTFPPVIARHVSVVAIFPLVSTEPGSRKIATGAERPRNDEGGGTPCLGGADPSPLCAMTERRDPRQSSAADRTEAERCLHRRRHDRRPTATSVISTGLPWAGAGPPAHRYFCHFDRSALGRCRSSGSLKGVEKSL
jgi:hypothetical protein